MIKKCLTGEYSADPSVCDFKKTYRKKLFKAGNTSTPNFCLNDHGTLFHIKRIRKTEQKCEVVSVSRAKELVRLMHQHKAEGICVPGGINTLVRSFTANYYCRGIRKIVQSVLDHCCGTCKLSKTLKTVAPVPVANRTKEVMEEVQCDLITIVSKKGVISSKNHDFKYILTVKDCFSKYCWLLPLITKEAAPIAHFLAKLFHEHGPPKFLHSDNGKEFVNSIVKQVCMKYDVSIKHGRPYHPQSQGQVENLNRRVKNCLRHFLLEYPDSERTEVWPKIIKEIQYFLNHSWHHTIRTTPHAVFYGRTGLRNEGTMTAPQFMEEDYMYMNDDENELNFDLHSTLSTSNISIPNYHTGNNEILSSIGRIQIQQVEQKRAVFESSEAMVSRNRRAHIRKLKPRDFRIGECVLFKNPENDGLATTLNVRGVIEEKVGRDLYRVGYAGNSVILFGSLMTPHSTMSEDDKLVTRLTDTTLTPEVVLDR